MRLKDLFVSGLMVGCVVTGGIAQQPTQAPPVFRSTVDVVAVDVNVVDNEGRPVVDLRPDDFTVTVDGQPRRIVSATYVPQMVPSASRAPAATGPSLPRPTTTYSSNDSSVGGGAVGRMIVLVVDQNHISLAAARQLVPAARRFLERLSPEDRVALVALPAGVRIDFTSNHTRLLEGLGRVLGAESRLTTLHTIGMSEAIDVELGNNRLMQEIIRRNCAPGDLSCPAIVEQETRLLARNALQSTEDSMTSLRALIDGLKNVDGAKTLVFLSEGFVRGRAYSELAWVSAAAASARVSLYVLQLEAAMFDASQSRISPTFLADSKLKADGLSELAGLARGAMFHVVGSGDGAFTRLALELSGYYLLGFEPQAEDRNGRSHRIRVEVARKNVDVRARREFAVFTAVARPKTDDQILFEMLGAPLLVRDLPLKVAAFAEPDADAAKIQVVLSAEIERPPGRAVETSLAVVLFDQHGNPKATWTDKITGQLYARTLLVEPGPYRVKLAAIDKSGRRGTIEHEFQAVLTATANLKLGDLMLAEMPRDRAEGLHPAVNLEAGGERVMATLGISADRGNLGETTIQLEIAETADAEALLQTPAVFESIAAASQVAKGVFDIGPLPPGDYVARAVVSAEGQTVGRVSRGFRIVKTVATAPPSKAVPTGSSGGSPAAIGSVTGRKPTMPRFGREAVLDKQVVGLFLDRMSADAAPSATLSGAIQNARGGQFDALINETPTDEKLATTAGFLRGLTHYAKGDLEAAAGEFRQTLKIDSDFYPGLVYLGACYAAGGRDREAAGAWQMSLIFANDVAVIYHLLADAFLRLGEGQQAMKILGEAATRWPNDDRLAFRQAAAYIMTGRLEDSLQSIEQHLKQHPTDLNALLLAIQIIYESHLAGRPVPKANAAERITQYAQAYAAAGGPQEKIVAQWVKFVQRKQGPKAR